MNGKHNYVEELDKAICEYCDSPGPDRFLKVLWWLFEGIDKNCSLPCPAEMDLEKLNAKPMFLRKESDKEHLVLLTSLDGEKYPTIADIRLRAIMRLILSVEDCEGIIFNPSGEHSLFVPKQFLATALSAGYNIAIEEIENGQKTKKQKTEFRFSDDNSIKIRRPVEWTAFEVIEDRIRNLTEDEDDYVIVDLIEDKDDLRFIQTIRHGELWYVELAYDMSDFGKDYPLILGAEMSLEEAIELFNLICLHGVSPDDISMVQERFRDIGFSGQDGSNASD